MVKVKAQATEKAKDHTDSKLIEAKVQLQVAQESVGCQASSKVGILTNELDLGKEALKAA